MSEETTPTRQETVEANIAAAIAKYGSEATEIINNICLQDISVSIAMLVDAGTTTT